MSAVILTTPAERFVVVAGGEYAQFFVTRGWRDDGAGWMDLAVNSTLGCGGYYWHNCGPGDWRLFLAGLDQQYALHKLFGRDAVDPFDADATLAAAKTDLLRRRRESEVSRIAARKAWELLREDAETRALPRELRIGRLMGRLSGAAAFADRYWDVAVRRRVPAMDSFWAVLWRPWVAHLAAQAMGK